jgi:NAD(P)-dependent dehydrogenase (short-subunit alcohol dehydrogenase family)
MSKAALATFMSVGRGVIVNISSISGLRGTGTTAYGASKAAVNQLTRDMALSYGANGIRVNAVVPGGIETPMSIGALSPESRRAFVYSCRSKNRERHGMSPRRCSFWLGTRRDISPGRCCPLMVERVRHTCHQLASMWRCLPEATGEPEADRPLCVCTRDCRSDLFPWALRSPLCRLRERLLLESLA